MLTIIRVIICLSLLSSSITRADAMDRGVPEVLASFLQIRCASCHSDRSVQADMLLTDLGWRSDHGQAETWDLSPWHRVLQVVDDGRMPPDRGSDFADQWNKAREPIVRLLRKSESRIAGVPLRRINQREYDASIEALFGTALDVAKLLPDDNAAKGFDTTAEMLPLSGAQLEAYLQAANEAVDRVIDRFEPIEPNTRLLQMMDSPGNQSIIQRNLRDTAAQDGAIIKYAGGWPPPSYDDVLATEAGRYRCRLAVWPVAERGRSVAITVHMGIRHLVETHQFIGIYDLFGDSSNPRVIEFEADLDAGHTFVITPNLPRESDPAIAKMFGRTGIAIQWAEIEGPLEQGYPSSVQRRTFGDPPTLKMVPRENTYFHHHRGLRRHELVSDAPKNDARAILADFLPRAFRRPVTADELQPYVTLVESQLHRGRTFEESIRSGLVAALCSPQFLLIGASADYPEHHLASRLAYFLTSGPPDKPLRTLADAGKLASAKTLAVEVDRLIDGNAIDGLVNDFTDQWLDLDQIEATTPDKELYPEFDPLLQWSMVQEARQLFQYVLRENRPLFDLVSCDYTLLNERLAEVYEVPGIYGQEKFRLVELPQGGPRGGVLTQAGVLKVTADGTSTSPIRRGVFVAERLLGIDLPMPPEGIEAVEPDVRGATSIRDLLSRHAEDESCNRCHRVIDPPGFVLEQFDPIGQRRSFYRSQGGGTPIRGVRSYRRGLPVDPTATWVDGRDWDDVADFQQFLQSIRPRIERGIVKQLISYATGHPVDAWMNPIADEIIQTDDPEGIGLRTVIHRIVQSDVFRVEG